MWYISIPPIPLRKEAVKVPRSLGDSGGFSYCISLHRKPLYVLPNTKGEALSILGEGNFIGVLYDVRS